MSGMGTLYRYASKHAFHSHARVIQVNHMEPSSDAASKAKIFQTIEIGRKYRLFSGAEVNCPKTHILQFMFKPANVEEQTSGNISISSTNEALVVLKGKSGEQENFKGVKRSSGSYNTHNIKAT